MVKDLEANAKASYKKLQPRKIDSYKFTSVGTNTAVLDENGVHDTLSVTSLTLTFNQVLSTNLKNDGKLRNCRGKGSSIPPISPNSPEKCSREHSLRDVTPELRNYAVDHIDCYKTDVLEVGYVAQ